MRIKKSYNTSNYKFRECISDLFKTEDLCKIHETEKCDFGILNIENDQGTSFHKTFYDKMRKGPFLDLYYRFVKSEILPQFNESILYQKIPTFRIQVPENLGVAEFHKDKEYSHSPHEVNIFLPFTDAIGNNTIWSETYEDLSDFSPMDTLYGEYFIWDGANLKHGNKINDTGKTRISIDFRVMPYSKYDESEIKETITMKTKIKIGDYFDLIEKD
jgi:hypothetical protein